MRDLIASLDAEFRRFEAIGRAALGQVSEPQLVTAFSEGGNSIAVLVWHLAGNFRSRFTDFLTTDGEKPWRHRDEEFDDRQVTAAELTAKWEAGWAVLFDALNGLTDADLARTVRIRGVEFKVHEALHRAVGHTAYHVGQIVFAAKALRAAEWRCLTIPRGASEAYNENPALDRPAGHAASLGAPDTEPRR